MSLFEDTASTSNEDDVITSILDDEDECDELYDLAKEVVYKEKRASAALLQRKLRIGYARAARLLDMLEEKGIIGPADGMNPREIY